jgi:hypothetical protein
VAARHYITHLWIGGGNNIKLLYVNVDDPVGVFCGMNNLRRLQKRTKKKEGVYTRIIRFVPHKKKDQENPRSLTYHYTGRE